MILTAKPFSFLLIFSSWMTASSTLAYTLDRSSGDIEFSVRPVLPSNPLNRVYDTSTSANSLQGGLLAPGRGYPLISDPISPVQKKSGSIAPALSDIWNDPRGSADMSVEAFSLLDSVNSTGVYWIQQDYIRDTVVDNNAVRDASFGSSIFTSTSSRTVQEFVYFNMSGSIDTKQTDAWVTGALTGKFGGTAPTNTFEILFGFDGVGRGREDFIVGFVNGLEVNPYPGSYSNFYDDGFSISHFYLEPLFDIKAGDQISMEGTLTCVAFNGGCTNITSNFFVQDVNLPDVPEIDPQPITMLGSFLAIGFSTILKRKTKIS
jgi:hypothetical protein